VHAVEPLGSFARAIFSTYSGPSEKHAYQAIDKILANIKAQVVDSLADDYMAGMEDLGTICDVVVDQGPAADVILNHALVAQADLIVIGGQSARGDGVPLLGSVATKILQRATIPVFTIPLAQRHLEGELSQGEQLGLW
jgi:nucleotide-binding universal stress UspA family protein